jgi:hypothetical protein
MKSPLRTVDASALSLIKLGHEPQHLFRISFNGRMKEKFVPLLLQSRGQHFPSDPRRGEQIVAILGFQGTSSQRGGMFHDVASPWPTTGSADGADLHSMTASARSPRKASSSACDSSQDWESSCLSSAMRRWIAFFASSMRRGNSSGRSSNIAARWSSRQSAFIVICQPTFLSSTQTTSPTKNG